MTSLASRPAESKASAMMAATSPAAVAVTASRPDKNYQSAAADAASTDAGHRGCQGATTSATSLASRPAQSEVLVTVAATSLAAVTVTALRPDENYQSAGADADRRGRRGRRGVMKTATSPAAWPHALPRVPKHLGDWRPAAVRRPDAQLPPGDRRPDTSLPRGDRRPAALRLLRDRPWRRRQPRSRPNVGAQRAKRKREQGGVGRK